MRTTVDRSKHASERDTNSHGTEEVAKAYLQYDISVSYVTLGF